ncbi:MAG: hypothetical protein KY456_05310, partial [Chloroflexi bacterium]|nr:hypothetical protein [Chloroflexota bacterium]
VVLGGRLWAKVQIPDAAPSGELEDLLQKSWDRFLRSGMCEPDHDSVDDMHILGSWLARHEGHPAILSLGDRTAGPDWRLLAQGALALRPDDLDFDAWRKARDAGDSGWGEIESEAVMAARGDS